MKTIALIIMVAIVLEALVEYAKTMMHMVEDEDYKTAITQGVTILLGVFLAIVFNLQLFNNALSEFYEGLHINPVIDMVLTGILFSRGSNYISDLLAKLTGSTPQLIVDDTDLIYEEEEVEDDAVEEVNEA